MANDKTFEYTYSAPQQTEIQMIREKYLPKEVSKLDQLRMMDERVTRRGTAVSTAHGILFTLILGIGMCCCMVWSGFLFIPGIAIGCIGIGGIAATYPLYNRIVEQDRKRFAPEILRLSEELILGFDHSTETVI